MIQSVDSGCFKFTLCTATRYCLVQNEFWVEMLKPEPSLSRLNEIGDAVKTYTALCETCFQKQLSLSPNSVQTLRRYAQFLLEVSNNPGKSMKLSQQAEDLEDLASKEHSDVTSNLQLYQAVSTMDAAREDVSGRFMPARVSRSHCGL